MIRTGVQITDGIQVQAENLPVLTWSAYSPELSPIENVLDALDRHVRQRVLVSTNIHQLCIAIDEEWDNSLMNSMQRRCVVLHVANRGHTRYGLVF
jgi:hypothetical protein